MSSAASTETNILRPWQFFVLAAIVSATAAVLLSRDASPAHIVFVSLAIGAAGLTGIAVYRTLWPLVASDPDEGAEMLGGRTRAALERDKTLVLRSIKELEFDRAMGKVSDADFQEMNSRLRARAAGLIRQLDRGGSGYRELIELELARRLAAAGSRQQAAGSDPVRSPVARSLSSANASEQQAAGSAQARMPPASDAIDVEATEPTCSSCGITNDADARFCKACGTRLQQ